MFDTLGRPHHHGRSWRYGTVIGPARRSGTVLEETLSRITEYWQILLGPLLLLVVLFARGGIDGLLGKVRHV
jgi:branched-chain amino acid transport system permease protein